jgi:hypothetical protein
MEQKTEKNQKTEKEQPIGTAFLNHLNRKERRKKAALHRLFVEHVILSSPYKD